MFRESDTKPITIYFSVPGSILKPGKYTRTILFLTSNN